MAKRFTDTAKWDKAWFRKLTPRLKCAWEFLRDRCDSAGVWEIDLEAMEFFIGEAVTLSEIQSYFKVTLLTENKLFMPTFIDFQYGTLSEDCKPHQSVIQKLKKLTLWEGYTKGFQTFEDKEEDKEKEKDQEKEKEKEGGPGGKRISFDFDSVYRTYPLKRGKVDGLDQCKKQVKTLADFGALQTAVQIYRDHFARPLNPGEFRPEPKHFDTFMRNGRWRECLEPGWGDPPPTVAGKPREKTWRELVDEDERREAEANGTR